MYTFSVRRRSQIGMIYVTCINRFFFQIYVITEIIYEHSGNLPLDVECHAEDGLVASNHN